jgi:hypothetical protein
MNFKCRVLLAASIRAGTIFPETARAAIKAFGPQIAFDRTRRDRAVRPATPPAFR